MFVVDGVESEDDDEEDVLRQSREPEILPIDSELQHDIEELAREEQDMLRLADTDRDEDEDGEVVETYPGKTSKPQKEHADEKGRSHHNAIALDDSEDEMEEKVVAAIDPGNNELFHREGALPDCKLYKFTTQSPSLGVEIAVFKGRVVVANKVGGNKKPDAGDLLVALGDQILPTVRDVNHVLPYLRRFLQSPPSVLWFAEDSQFHNFYKTWRANNPDPTPVPSQKKRQISEVIELDD